MAALARYRSQAPDTFVFVINNPSCLKYHNKINDLLQEEKNTAKTALHVGKQANRTTSVRR